MFSVHTLAARPYRVLFASSTASTGVRKVISTTTGPKISTWAIVAAGATSVNRVGGKNQPSRGQLHEGCHSTAPSSRPRCTRSWIFCNCTGAMIAPMSTALSSGSPTRSVSILALSLTTSRSATPSGPPLPALGPAPQPVGPPPLHQNRRAGAADLPLVEPDRVHHPFDHAV